MAISAHPQPDPSRAEWQAFAQPGSLVVGVVEDSDEDFAVFRRVLSRHASQARIKRWGRAEPLLESLEAGLLVDGERPDVLIVDLTLPGIDGVELVRRLRSHPQTQATPVYVLSGSGRQRDIDRSYEAGADAYFRKSGSSADLRALLDRVLGSPERPDPRAGTDGDVLLCEARPRRSVQQRLSRLRDGAVRRSRLPAWPIGAELWREVALGS